MSAWIVSKAHIDALVTALVAAKLVKPALVNSTGAMLWAENYKSVNARYGERDSAPEYTYASRPTNAGELYQAIHCYKYQSCEHRDWDGSRSHRLMQSLEDTINVLAPGFEILKAAAPWGIE